MKFYIASKFEKSENVKEVQQRLTEEGHQIIVDWTQQKISLTTPKRDRADNIYIIGELREDSLFYFHQDVERRDDIGEVLAEL